MKLNLIIYHGNIAMYDRNFCLDKVLKHAIGSAIWLWQEGTIETTNPFPIPKALNWTGFFPYPGSWEENWFTPWQAYRVNPTNLLIDQKISNDSEDSEDLVSERPQIGVMVTVWQNVNESLTRVSFMHSSNLRQSRWRKKFYPYGIFPF